MPRKKTRKSRKQSSDRASRIAARILALFQQLKREGSIGPVSPVIRTDGVRWRDVATLAASVLSQDETSGPRKPRKRAGRR